MTDCYGCGKGLGAEVSGLIDGLMSGEVDEDAEAVERINTLTQGHRVCFE